MMMGYKPMNRLWRRLAVATLAVTGAAFLLTGTADARVGSAKNFGSRGGKTFTAPPSTNTAPKTTQPIERSTTQIGSTRTAAAGAKSGGFLSSIGGMRGLLLGGLLGAGLASLFGLGGGLASFLGLILQAALIAGIVYLVVQLFRRRRGAPAAGPTMATASAEPVSRSTLSQQPYASTPAGGNVAAGTGALSLTEADFNAFEKMLGEIQMAYSNEDEATMRSLTTPEMLGYLGEDVNANIDKGLRNELSSIKLLQGDLSEAWTEHGQDYATVAMRYSIIDTMVDRNTGKLVSGSKTQPEEVTEVWTFVRPARASINAWKLSAIQQA